MQCRAQPSRLAADVVAYTSWVLYVTVVTARLTG